MHPRQLQLVSAPSCAATVERYLRKPPPQALSQAGREVLAIVAYEQPITRADISDIRGVDSSAVVETLMARKLIAEDPRFGGRGRPAFLVTTRAFLEYFGLSSLSVSGDDDRLTSSTKRVVSVSFFCKS